MQVRPEAQQKLNAGFQRRVDQQASRYGQQLAYAEELAARYECGRVAGVFTAKAGGGVPRRAYVVGLLPLAGRDPGADGCGGAPDSWRAAAVPRA